MYRRDSRGNLHATLNWGWQEEAANRPNCEGTLDKTLMEAMLRRKQILNINLPASN